MHMVFWCIRIGVAAGLLMLAACSLAPTEYAHLRDGALPTNRVVVTGSRIPQRVSANTRNPSASSNVRVVTNEDLKNAQGVTVGDAISSVPGVW